MKIKKQVHLNDQTSSPISKKRVLPLVASDDSHTTNTRELKASKETISIEVHLTVRSKVRFTRRQVSLFANVLIYEILEKGLNLERLILTEYFISRIAGSRLKVEIEMKDERELITVLNLQSILFSAKSLNLGSETKEIPEDIKNLIRNSPYLPSQRTINSWRQTYSIEKFFEILTVPVDLQFEKASNTQPYDSYCKGYGESHPSAKRKKTRISSELDGEETDQEDGKLHLLSISYLLDYDSMKFKYTKKSGIAWSLSI